MELLSNSHMSNSLLYSAVQVTLYLVAVAQSLLHINSDLAELASSRDERDELRKKVLGLEEENRKFEEHYDLLSAEKVSVEEPTAELDGSVERFSYQTETLVEANKVLENQVEEQRGHLEVEVVRRKAAEEGVAWFL